MAMRKNDKRAARVSDYDVPTTEGITLDETENAYAEARDKGHRVDPRLQKIFILIIVLVALYFVGLVMPTDIFNPTVHSTGYGAGYSFAWFVKDLQSNINGLLAALTGNEGYGTAYSITMIRYVIIAMTGAGLAVCGAVYQGSFKNALVSPSTLGVMSGASLGIMLWVAFVAEDDGSNTQWLTTSDAYNGQDLWEYMSGAYSLSFTAFIGCVLVVALVLLVMKLSSRGSSNGIFMIITGQVIGSIMGAVGNTVRYYYLTLNPYGTKASLLTDLQIASFYRAYTWVDLLLVGIPILITFVVVMALRRKMTLMQFSEGEARSMGVDSKRMQVIVVGLCTLLTAILISFCGQVGFVGFLVPHLARRLVGPNFSYLLPAATVLGAVFVLGAYVLLITLLGTEYDTMVGMFISIGGAAVFLVTALRGKGGVRGEFK